MVLVPCHQMTETRPCLQLCFFFLISDLSEEIIYDISIAMCMAIDVFLCVHMYSHVFLHMYIQIQRYIKYIEIPYL